ncbi:MAG: type I-B CRISPR-associated protein Cas5 [Bacteroidales bacterium]|nr:type I-B CRISPR-associated protein Cas5 [Bacteroidales bacterium]
MDVTRIKITSWTSGFRYPNLISAFQPTLEVPPLSTILGLINAAAGSYQYYKQLTIGYYFEYKAKSTDLESIYQIELHKTQNYPLNEVKSNVINREFLYDCSLYLYIPDERITGYFKRPVYQLLLGRSNDLASVDKIEKVTLAKVENAQRIRGQVVPFMGNYLAGDIQPLPKYFTDTIPRTNIGTEPYSVISHISGNNPSTLIAYTDIIEDKIIDIYFHEINFEK